jgi:hypothetical protein
VTVNDVVSQSREENDRGPRAPEEQLARPWKPVRAAVEGEGEGAAAAEDSCSNVEAGGAHGHDDEL